MMRAAALLLLALPLVAARPAPRRLASPAVLATCTDLKGKTFAVSPKSGWDNERLGATISFTRTAKGQIDILSDGQSIRQPGMTLAMTHNSRDFAYFIVTARWQQARADIWQITFEPDGRGRLLWSTLRSHMPPGDVTSGALYVASCTR